MARWSYDYIVELAEFRDHMRLSQEKFADLAGLEVSLIRRIEQGRKDMNDLSLKQINRIASTIFDYDEYLGRHFCNLYMFCCFDYHELI